MKECEILKRDQSKKKSKAKEKDDGETTAVVVAHDNMFVFCDDDQVNIICYDSDWVVDLDAFYYVTLHRHFLLTCTE